MNDQSSNEVFEYGEIVKSKLTKEKFIVIRKSFKTLVEVRNKKYDSYRFNCWELEKIK